jgi:hypothetical protein
MERVTAGGCAPWASPMREQGIGTNLAMSCGQ